MGPGGESWSLAYAVGCSRVSLAEDRGLTATLCLPPGEQCSGAVGSCLDSRAPRGNLATPSVFGPLLSAFSFEEFAMCEHMLYLLFLICQNKIRFLSSDLLVFSARLF